MAKPKRGVALFEVIQKDKRFARHGGALPAPAWMNKGKPTAAPPPATPPPPSVAAAAAPTPDVPLAVPGPGEIQANAGDSWPVMRPTEEFAPVAPGRSRGASPLTAASAAIIGSAILVVLVLGILVTRWSHPLSPGEAALQGPANPAVLDVGGKLARTAGAPAAAPIATPAAAVQPPRRVAGMSYVVIHLYITLHSATQTSQMLTQHDVPCTVEHGIPGIAPPYYAVIGLKPFARINSPDYAPYVARIKSLLPPSSQTAKAFKPQLLKWTPPAESAGQTG